MSSTACDDQFTVGTQTIERIRAPYDPIAVLKRNVAALEVALKQQAERAEAAEAELANLREQKPVAWINLNKWTPSNWPRCVTPEEYEKERELLTKLTAVYAAPVPAPHKGATHCDDCGLTWLDDGLNPLGCPYCKVSAPAPAVPAEWREAMQEAHDTFQRYADLHWAKDTRDSHEKAKVNQKLANKLYALLQSAEVRHD